MCTALQAVWLSQIMDNYNKSTRVFAESVFFSYEILLFFPNRRHAVDGKKVASRVPLMLITPFLPLCPRHQRHPLHPADRDEDSPQCPKGQERGDISTSALPDNSSPLVNVRAAPGPLQCRHPGATTSATTSSLLFFFFCLALHLLASPVIESFHSVLEAFVFCLFYLLLLLFIWIVRDAEFLSATSQTYLVSVHLCHCHRSCTQRLRQRRVALHSSSNRNFSTRPCTRFLPVAVEQTSRIHLHSCHDNSFVFKEPPTKKMFFYTVEYV